MGKKIKKVNKIVWAIYLLAIVFVGFTYISNKIVDKQLRSTVTERMLTSNIRVIGKGRTESGNSISPGASGSIFHKEDNTYYAVTAYHVISDYDKSTEYLILTEEDLNFSEHLKVGGEFKGISEYYEKFPKAKVEFIDILNDVAIISFESDKNLEALDIVSYMPKKGDKIISISNPNREKGIVKGGKIKSSELKSLIYSKGDKQEHVMKHSAQTASGSSGSAILNEHFEIIGINIGGSGLKIFNKNFSITGHGIPTGVIDDFMKKVEEIKKY